MRRAFHPLVAVAVFVGLAAAPAFADPFYLQLLTKALVLAIFAMSLDLLVGYTGLVSFGHAAYFGIAAYAAALLAPETEPSNLLVALPASVLVAALFALAVGALVVRTRGVFFIMVTLAFAQMAFFAVHDSSAFGGSDGLLLFSRPEIALDPWVHVDLADGVRFYALCLLLLGATYCALTVLVSSPFGRVIQGIKENESRMRALGYATDRYKLVSFVIGGAFAGLAGFLIAHQSEYVSPALLGWRESGLVLMMVILGGRGTLLGPVIGALVLVLVQEALADLTAHWMLAMGIFVVLAVLLMPDGIAGLPARLGGRPTATDGGPGDG